MKKSMVYLAVIVLSGLFAHTYGADKFFGIQFGPQWPLGIEKKPALDITAVGGLSVDRKAFFGGAIDFIWSKSATEEKVGENRYRLDVNERMFMVPISGYIGFNPVPDLVVNPMVSAQVGLNNMYYALKRDSEDSNDENLDVNGWYMGLFLRFAADAYYPISENSGFIGGLYYQHSRPKKLSISDTNNEYNRRNMSGFGLRIGFQATL